MKKLLMGTAIVLGMTQASYAASDTTIMSIIIKDMGNMDLLCAELENLSAADKKRLQKIMYNEPKTAGEKQIKAQTDINAPLAACINKINNKSSW